MFGAVWFICFQGIFFLPGETDDDEVLNGYMDFRQRSRDDGHSTQIQECPCA